jgi:hypothetical protein
MEDMSHLTGQAIERERMWPTPHSNASTGAGTQGREGGENLQTAVAVTGTKLNSAWVSRMQGYPDGWLTLDGEAIR